MVNSTIHLPDKALRKLKKHLFQPGETEQVAFIFANIVGDGESVEFRFKQIMLVGSNEYVFQRSGYVELKDATRCAVIKKAAVLNAGIVEIHSHLDDGPAIFSDADFCGFHDFVPHVWWRLNGRPYAALVFSKSSFDGLVWAVNPEAAEPLTRITVTKYFWRRHLYPSNLSLGGRWDIDITAS